jgi:hypothetical protein
MRHKIEDGSLLRPQKRENSKDQVIYVKSTKPGGKG